MPHHPAVDPHTPAHRFRPATAADVPALLPLLRQLWPHSAASDTDFTAALHAALASPARAVFVAELAPPPLAHSPSTPSPTPPAAQPDAPPAPAIVGLATLALATDLWHTAAAGAHLDEFVIDAAYRSQGLGAAFLDFVLAETKSRGKRVLELTSAAHRERAHRFYLRQGFSRRDTHVYARELS